MISQAEYHAMAYRESAFRVLRFACFEAYESIGIGENAPTASQPGVGHFADEAPAVPIGGEAVGMRNAITFYGKTAAAMRIDGDPLNDATNQARIADDNNAMRYVEVCVRDEQSCMLLSTYLMRRAEVLVENYWPEIQAVAKSLMVSSTLEGDEFARIFSASYNARLNKGEPVALMSW